MSVQKSPDIRDEDAPLRIITATAIFDGHDVSINIIRRLLQDRGCEIVHLGYNRSVDELVKAAIEEDVDGLCVSSYQGGHLEYFSYLKQQLIRHKLANLPVYIGGGGTISEKDAQQLKGLGSVSVFTATSHPGLGLADIADAIVADCFMLRHGSDIHSAKSGSPLAHQLTDIIRSTTDIENHHPRKAHVIGVTGTGGAGKSTIIDELIRFYLDNTSLQIACLAIDPARDKTGGALLGDRIRMCSIDSSRVYYRSFASRQDGDHFNRALSNAISLLDEYAYDLIIIETSGIGQADHSICDLVDHSIYVMSADYGAPGQLEKIAMLDYADTIVLNKCDHLGSEDALSAITDQWHYNHQECSDQIAPVYALTANVTNDIYNSSLPLDISKRLNISLDQHQSLSAFSSQIIPHQRQNYLSRIVEQAQHLKKYQAQQCHYINRLQHIFESLALIDEKNDGTVSIRSAKEVLRREFSVLMEKLDDQCLSMIKTYDDRVASLKADFTLHTVKGRSVKQKNKFKTLSRNEVSVISPPTYTSWRDQLNFIFNENFAGEFPFTAGVYRYRNSQEEPTRMFAGEGAPEDTNRRFFKIKQSQKATRLSTAFDPLVLYGKDPSSQQDVYGCIGMSGVSVATLDDMKKLYSGINLCDEATSVSMTINGPAPVIMAFYLIAAVDQQIEMYFRETGTLAELDQRVDDYFGKSSRPIYEGDRPAGHEGLGLVLLGVDSQKVVSKELYSEIFDTTCRKIRGTLQADILKEDQAQNECLYSLEFSLKLMADMQKYFIQQNIDRFYSVSISGYHIAEAGANPVTQLAFTLANGFTLIEYYLSQGMSIDDFCPHFSFFFSNGMDAEYAVIGRVARRIWSRALKYVYGAAEASQKLKYHIQTSGRSLQARDIDINDIRTTLQAIYAIYDNCNSLHTNAYNEAVTTPTEESLHRALAIQLIINREYGINNNQNINQGSFIIQELTDLVEEAVYKELERISARGGVIGAMEFFYQRQKIQQESFYAETLKNSGELPVIGVNQFVDDSDNRRVSDFIHSSRQQKDQQVKNTSNFIARHKDVSQARLDMLKSDVIQGRNSFSALLDCCRYATLQQMSSILLSIGGEYRRRL